MNLKIAFSDRFRKTYRNLKKNEQELVDKGIDTWRNNPDNPSSNFEKLSFVGDNIFSIRANSAWRIIMAKFDDTYLILHTGGQHDDTNDWAKNKRIDRNELTGAIQIYDINIEEINHRIEDVKYNENDEAIFQQYSDDELLAIGVPETHLETVKKVKSDDQYLKLWDYLPEDALENLEIVKEGVIDIKILISQIKDSELTQVEKIEDVIKIQPGIHIVGEDQKIIDAINQDINLFRFYLHPKQKFLVEKTFNGPVKLVGGAGTGKTVVALHRTKHLVDSLKANDKPVFFTTYTTNLIKNIQKLFKDQNIDDSKLLVSNLHQFAFEYSKKLGVIESQISIISSEKQKEGIWIDFVRKHPAIQIEPLFLMNEYEKVIQQKHVTTLESYKNVLRSGMGSQLLAGDREKVWEAIEKYETYQSYTKTYTFEDIIFKLNKYLELWPEYIPFSHIICDELQDLNNIELRLLRNLVEKGENDLFLVGDPFQNIYQKQVNFRQSDVQIVGRSHRLKINYRTTEEIRQFANNALHNFVFEDFNGEKAESINEKSLINGSEPSYLTFESIDDQLEYIKNYIKESFGQIGLHELCIVARTSDQVDEIYEYLRSIKLPVVKLSELQNLDLANDKVVVATMHGVKGLEFKNVIVYGIDKKSFLKKPRGFKNWSEEDQNSFIKSEYALLYVVFSRAISNLILLGLGEKVEF